MPSTLSDRFIDLGNALPSSILILMATCIISSVAYYFIAALLAVSPPTSGLGVVLLGRVHDAKLNWHVHVIRSFLETAFWVGVIGFAYFGSTDEAGESNSMVDRKLIEAVLWGTMSGVGVVLLGDVCTRCLDDTLEVRFKVNVSAPNNVPRRLSSKLDDEAEEDEQQEETSNIFAYFGTFIVLYIFSFLGYQTLSFIFSFPYSLNVITENANSNQPFSITNIVILHILLATIAGVTFTATASLLVSISPTLGEVLLTRVTHTYDNWRVHTKRSMLELGGWLLAVSGSFHLRYYGTASLLDNTTDAAGLCNSSSCINNKTCENDDSAYEDDAMRAVWALLWALQLGTLVGCALVLGVHHFSGDNLTKQSAIPTKSSKAKPISDQKAAVTSGSTCAVREKARKDGLVLLDGNWYNVEKFVHHHPGGVEVLEQYLGADISFVFRVMHRNPTQIMKYRKPVRAATPEELEALTSRRQEVCLDMMDDFVTNSIDIASPEMLPKPTQFDLKSFEKDFIDLYEEFVAQGYFKPSTTWLLWNTAVLISIIALSVISMKVLPPTSFVLPGALLGLFWHQSGFLMHDAEHHNLAGNERLNDILGWIYGTVFLGVNGAWWREEHREHHAFLNTYDDESGFKDPQVCQRHCRRLQSYLFLSLLTHSILFIHSQMREDVWIQNKKLIPFFGDEIIHFLTNFQHILFLPIIFIVGRVGIVVDSTLTERKFRPWSKCQLVFIEKELLI
jgi:hypothetical protein